jgi:uncharacterized protein
MEAIFVDTSAWDAIEDSSDRHHAAALRFKEELVQQQTRLYVTNFILDESYTLLLYNIGYTRTVAFKRTIDLIQTGGILIVSMSAKRLNKQPGQSLSDSIRTRPGPLLTAPARW